MEEIRPLLETAPLTMLRTLIELGPVFAVPFLLGGVAAIWARRADAELVRTMSAGQGPAAIALETIVFGMLGVALAYLSFMTRNGIITEITSSIIAGSAVILQLLGLSTEKVKAPLSNIKVLWAATAAILSFLLAVRYLALLFKLPVAG